MGSAPAWGAVGDSWLGSGRAEVLTWLCLDNLWNYGSTSLSVAGLGGFEMPLLAAARIFGL